jgi:hypothetical protein
MFAAYHTGPAISDRVGAQNTGSATEFLNPRAPLLHLVYLLGLRSRVEPRNEFFDLDPLAPRWA